MLYINVISFSHLDFYLKHQNFYRQNISHAPSYSNTARKFTFTIKPFTLESETLEIFYLIINVFFISKSLY